MPGQIGLTMVAMGSLVTAMVPTAYTIGTTHHPEARRTAAHAAPHAVNRPDLAPSLPKAGDARLARSDDGFFYADARINGHPVRLLVDTGASALMLPAQQARRLGVNMHALAYDGHIRTSSGTARIARVTIDRMTVAGQTFEDVPAMILPRGDSVGLMGQAVLARFRSVSIEGDMLALR
ncbi:TIGR02281 family clan AA aspartic protease [Sphingomonas sp. AP4-R1]|uniref:retropepsin-like aspartic protease family protein n=1 Tax=Sphingomonas sp. AP4-R1 TaxID=2735134 RepID=UPI00149348D7|nr:TIGR02281 family clan AA aspartic protease [Sphingomonas sp. AP4-R1]QJU57593.1 TIGR02281 family clan AA aspartic protease [Sphingomonas sp. AP4-R1]